MNKLNKLFDKYSCLHTIGCLLLDVNLIDDINRPLDRDDFDVERFYRIVFVAIYNLIVQGVEKVDEFAIDSYLSQYKEQYKIFEENNGMNYIINAREMASLDNYDWYYHRLRKFSLLRYYEKNHLDTSFIFNPDIEDENGSEQRKFDEYTETDIVELVENILTISPKNKYCSNILSKDCQAGEGIDDLIEELKIRISSKFYSIIDTTHLKVDEDIMLEKVHQEKSFIMKEIEELKNNEDKKRNLISDLKNEEEKFKNFMNNRESKNENRDSIGEGIINFGASLLDASEKECKIF